MEQKIIKDDMRLLSVKEVCALLGIGHWAVYQQINKRRLRTIRIGRRRLVSAKALQDFIKAMEQ